MFGGVTLTSPCLTLIRRAKFANRQAVLFSSGLMVNLPVVGVGRVGAGAGLVVGAGVLAVVFVTGATVVGEAVGVVFRSAEQVVTEKRGRRSVVECLLTLS